MGLASLLSGNVALTADLLTEIPTSPDPTTWAILNDPEYSSKTIIFVGTSDGPNVTGGVIGFPFEPFALSNPQTIKGFGVRAGQTAVAFGKLPADGPVGIYLAGEVSPLLTVTLQVQSQG